MEKGDKFSLSFFKKSDYVAVSLMNNSWLPAEWWGLMYKGQAFFCYLKLLVFPSV